MTDIKTEDIVAEQAGAQPLDHNEAGFNAKDFSAMNLVNRKERGMTYWQGIKRYRMALVYCLALSMGGLLNGLDGNIVGGVLGVPTFRRDFGQMVNGELVVPASWQSAWNGVQRLFCLIAALGSGYLADIWGRRGALLVASILSIASVFILFFNPPHNYVQALFGRIVNGAAASIYGCVAAMYCCELSPLPVRGLTTGGINMWIAIGQLVASCVLYATSGRDDSYAWKIPMAVQWSVPVMTLAALPWLPESPWHLVYRGNRDAAKKCLTRIYRYSGDNIEQHLERIEEVVNLEKHNNEQTSYLDLFRGGNLPRTIVVAGVFVCQEMAGVQFVLGFSTYFFQLAGFATKESFKLNVGTLAIAFVGNAIGLALINRVGRRPLFIWGMVACGLDCLALGICSLIQGHGALWGQAIFTVFYMLFYQSGIGPVAYALCAELGSAKLRSKTVAWGLAFNHLFIGITSIYLPYLVNPDEANLQGKVGWIFFGVCAIASVWAWFYIPETAGRNVDELDELFSRKIPMRKFHKIDLDTDRTATFNAKL